MSEISKKDDLVKEVIYRSCRQGGVRYEDIISKDGISFQWDFTEGLYMKSAPIWKLLEINGIQFKEAEIAEIFGNTNPVNIEIGIGNGEFTAFHALNTPNENWLGFEVFHKVFDKAISKARKVLTETKASNIRLIQFDAELFVRLLPESSVKNIYVNFPDPWPKAKHTKRRLLKTWFINLLCSKLVKGGVLTIATDHTDYANEITENIALAQGIESILKNLLLMTLAIITKQSITENLPKKEIYTFISTENYNIL